ncbi:MAG TPA: cytochrome c peroxidase [Gemmataceae bacterium]|jgi:cytochrome c peroxidase|nr:cytochrome c peroxidase [Gemmataceae bacterium]
MRTTYVLLLAVPLLAAAPPPLPRDTLPADIDLARIPAGFTARPADPADNPLTAAKARLGRRLFFDPILSGDRTVACASCHDPNHGFAGTNAVAVGARGQMGRRNAPSLLNVGYNASFFWDGRAASLEEQALMPIADPTEMASTPAEAVRRLRAEPSYVEQFGAALGGDVTAGNLAKALAAFERTLLAGDSPVDRFRRGEVAGLSADARQGLWLFESRGGCWRCHSDHNLTDGKFHNTGVGGGADLGRYAVTRREADHAAFKTPTLRNVAKTRPYMHDGSMASLEEVVRYYSRGGNANPNLDAAVKPLNLSEDDVRHLVAFLEALTGR